jgi:hypothetical protein
LKLEGGEFCGQQVGASVRTSWQGFKHLDVAPERTALWASIALLIGGIVASVIISPLRQSLRIPMSRTDAGGPDGLG